MMDTTSQIDTTAPELRPLWLRSEHQAPEELAADLKLGGVSLTRHAEMWQLTPAKYRIRTMCQLLLA